MLNTIIALGITFAVILGMGSISGLFSERSGTVNIAIEGMMIMGALVYALFAKSMDSDTSGWVQLPMYLIVGLLIALFAMLHGFACVTLKANQVASGTAINLLASGVALFVVNYVLAEEGGTNVVFEDVSLSSSKVDWGYAVSLPVILCLALFGVAYVFLNFTKSGKYIRAAGENPQALEAQGISVVRVKYLAIGISGFFAGIAGAVFAQQNGSFIGDVQGLGYIALAILVFGKWRIPWVLLGCLIFGVLTGLYTAISINPENISNENWIIVNKALFKVLPFAFSLVVLTFFSKNSKVPKALGVPYQKAK